MATRTRTKPARYGGRWFGRGGHSGGNFYSPNILPIGASNGQNVAMPPVPGQGADVGRGPSTGYVSPYQGLSGFNPDGTVRYPKAGGAPGAGIGAPGGQQSLRASRDDIVRLYYTILGRFPENEQAITSRLGMNTAVIEAQMRASAEGQQVRATGKNAYGDPVIVSPTGDVALADTLSPEDAAAFRAGQQIQQTAEARLRKDRQGKVAGGFAPGANPKQQGMDLTQAQFAGMSSDGTTVFYALPDGSVVTVVNGVVTGRGRGTRTPSEAGAPSGQPGQPTGQSNVINIPGFDGVKMARDAYGKPYYILPDGQTIPGDFVPTQTPKGPAFYDPLSQQVVPLPPPMKGSVNPIVEPPVATPPTTAPPSVPPPPSQPPPPVETPQAPPQVPPPTAAPPPPSTQAPSLPGVTRLPATSTQPPPPPPPPTAPPGYTPFFDGTSWVSVPIAGEAVPDAGVTMPPPPPPPFGIPGVDTMGPPTPYVPTVTDRSVYGAPPAAPVTAPSAPDVYIDPGSTDYTYAGPPSPPDTTYNMPPPPDPYAEAERLRRQAEAGGVTA